jgi:hypothetical protein|tara:strand:+ start:140 stop:334 length:195 start_codon:yes stop_codon:yes gene_type:complete
MPKKDILCILLLVIGSGRRRLNNRSGNARAKQRAVKRLLVLVRRCSLFVSMKMKEEKGDTKEEK